MIRIRNLIIVILMVFITIPTCTDAKKKSFLAGHGIDRPCEELGPGGMAECRSNRGVSVLRDQLSHAPSQSQQPMGLLMNHKPGHVIYSM